MSHAHYWATLIPNSTFSRLQQRVVRQTIAEVMYELSFRADCVGLRQRNEQDITTPLAESFFFVGLKKTTWWTSKTLSKTAAFVGSKKWLRHRACCPSSSGLPHADGTAWLRISGTTATPWTTTSGNRRLLAAYRVLVQPFSITAIPTLHVTEPQQQQTKKVPKPPRSRPAPKLAVYVNDRLLIDADVRTKVDTHPDGFQVTTLSANIPVKQHDVSRAALRVKCCRPASWACTKRWARCPYQLGGIPKTTRCSTNTSVYSTRNRHRDRHTSLPSRRYKTSVSPRLFKFWQGRGPPTSE
ncbi:hypothetical protein HPB51_027259 [Rhipicephalus microplus]|uniref:Uncharacterized protein n=1 Tax=Rhipicephalus microplus TaxID=6941 RepID=A0A9J6D0J5_RHIMP|nr:hypothetical protein HPB51_027259 [Rhipicephalus microplus]